MSEEILKNIHIELVAIRELLANQAKAPAAAQAKTYSGASSGGGGQHEVPPQPLTIHSNPKPFVVPFGKNQGKTLDELSDNSLSWYCKDPEPRMDSSGKPYPPRPADVELRNAARTLWHTRKGSLAGAPASEERHAPPPRSAAGATTSVDDGSDVPFAARWYDHG